MRVSVTFRALPAWPNNLPAHTYGSRERSPFRSTWGATLKDLDRELALIGARNIVIELDCPESEIRRDGVPRADARTRTPGVIISFEKMRRDPEGRAVYVGTQLQYDRYVYPCDTYHDWQDNVRAIAKTLEALRACDRYGVTTRGQQYAGFKQLPASTNGTISTERAAQLISEFGGAQPALILQDSTYAKKAIRTAQGATHPDRRGGSNDAFTLVGAAKRQLEAHFGGAL